MCGKKENNMKKLGTAVLAVMFLSTAAFAVDINLKVGAT
jgi:hypothetical protein